MSMRIQQGDRFKHKFTGQLYELKIINGDTYVLESADSPYRIWTGEVDLKLLFDHGNSKKKKIKNVKVKI